MASLPLITPSECAVVLVDYQAGLAFAAGSSDRQGIRSAALALAKTAVAFSVPVVVSTSATKVYSGPLIPPLRAVLADVVPIDHEQDHEQECTVDLSPRIRVTLTGRKAPCLRGFFKVPLTSARQAVALAKAVL